MPEYSDTDITGDAEDERDPVSRRIELQLLDSENHTMSDIYRKLGLYDDAAPLLEAALAAREEALRRLGVTEAEAQKYFHTKSWKRLKSFSPEVSSSQ